MTSNDFGRCAVIGDVLVVDDDGRVDDVPRVLVEASAEHLAELGPREERRRARVGRHEALAVVSHERQQVGPLLGREIDLAHAEEEDRVEVVQVPGEELLARRDAGAGLERDRRLVIDCESVRMIVSYRPDSHPRRSIVASACVIDSCW